MDSASTGGAARGSEQEKADAKRGLDGTRRAEGTSGGRADRGEQAEGKGRDGIDRGPGFNRDLMDLLNNPMFRNIPGGGRVPRG